MGDELYYRNCNLINNLADIKVYNYENFFFFSVQISLVEKPQMKIISFQKQKHRYKKDTASFHEEYSMNLRSIDTYI